MKYSTIIYYSIVGLLSSCSPHREEMPENSHFKFAKIDNFNEMANPTMSGGMFIYSGANNFPSYVSHFDSAKYKWHEKNLYIDLYKQKGESDGAPYYRIKVIGDSIVTQSGNYFNGYQLLNPAIDIIIDTTSYSSYCILIGLCNKYSTKGDDQLNDIDYECVSYLSGAMLADSDPNLNLW